MVVVVDDGAGGGWLCWLVGGEYPAPAGGLYPYEGGGLAPGEAGGGVVPEGGVVPVGGVAELLLPPQLAGQLPQVNWQKLPLTIHESWHLPYDCCWAQVMAAVG